MKLIKDIIQVKNAPALANLTGIVGTAVVVLGAFGVYKGWWSGEEYSVLTATLVPGLLWLYGKLKELHAMSLLKKKEGQIINLQDILSVLFDLKKDGDAPPGGMTATAAQTVVEVAKESITVHPRPSNRG